MQFRYRCPCYNYNYYHSIKRAGRFLGVAYIIILVHLFVNRCIGQDVLCVGNVHQTIVDCFVLEAFREYRDDLRDHVHER